MTTRELILKRARSGALRASQLAAELRISRQTITDHLRRLVEEGALVRLGHTRGALYRIPTKTDRRGTTASSLRFIKRTKELAEDRVFHDLASKLSLKSNVNVNVLPIISYAFTEMLNNVIEHSRSSQVWISAQLGSQSFTFEIRDKGIGVFQNVMAKYRLEDEFVALEHILKGKQTTVPDRHSGEGIFFTSQIADRFVLRSHQLELTIDNQREDTFVSEERFVKGTIVSFTILVRSKKKLSSVFEQYANEEYEFDKTVVRVRISSDREALSRSQARRLLIGLDKYKRLVFDFLGVKGIGQGFADEVFRVYAKTQPNITIEYQNANQAIEFMIRRARNNLR